METFDNDSAIILIQEVIIELLRNDKFKESFELMNKHLKSISNDLSNSILQNEAEYNLLISQIGDGLITQEGGRVEFAKLRKRLLIIINDKVPIEIHFQTMLGKLNTSIYKTTTNTNLEKILGPINHLVKTNWLQRGIEASKSVCKVVLRDGEQGTGFLLKGGYLMTNFHVIPNKEKASECKIIFDYEEDLFGNVKKQSEFLLEPEGAKFSNLQKYDYAYIKVKDNRDNPLSQWGYLDLDTFTDPQVGNPVSIIQHPFGQTKQIAVTSNKIIEKDGCKLFYQTDTERGSSGSPVFNQDWKVIALHHAGRTEDDGGLVVSTQTGERRGANEGILIKTIANDIGLTN
jgi:V8-like Glu-specific endopeptidase